MKIRVCDIETTGLKEDGGRICEIAWYDVAPRGPGEEPGLLAGSARAYLINPGMPMPPEVRAVHHIGDSELIGRPVPGWATAELRAGLAPGDMLCAHRADFEQSFIEAPGVPWLCTWKCALRAWPDARSHSNQALRYLLGLDEAAGWDSAAAMPPHRALPDAYTTAHILLALLRLRRPERLAEISAEPGFLPSLAFGKHRGERFDAVPLDYLQWIVGQSFDADIMATAQWHIDKRTRAKAKAQFEELKALSALKA